MNDDIIICPHCKQYIMIEKIKLWYISSCQLYTFWRTNPSSYEKRRLQ